LTLNYVLTFAYLFAISYKQIFYPTKEGNMKKSLKKVMIVPALLCALSLGACTCPQEAAKPAEPAKVVCDPCDAVKKCEAAAARAEAAAQKCEKTFVKGLKK
jgi:hypothetical protein